MTKQQDQIAVVDLGMGNIRSVVRALGEAADEARVSVEIVVTNDPVTIRASSKIVVPGQGAFRDACHALDGVLGETLRDEIRSGKPYFGICLGLQVLFESSEEAPGLKGLGLLQGHVRHIGSGIDLNHDEHADVKVPHMGWNQLNAAQHSSSNTLADALRGEPWFYFVHSFHAVPADQQQIAATCTHGPIEIVAAVAHNNIWAVQFHPEKSDRAGRVLLMRYLLSNPVRS